MVYAHCTCEEMQAALGDDGMFCTFCMAGFTEDDRCVACPHCHRLQLPHNPAGPCAVCEKPLQGLAEAVKP